MQKASDVKRLKRECIIAILIPSVLIGIFQISHHQFSKVGLLSIGLATTILIFCYLARFFSRLDDMVWQQQLHVIIQKISAPVIIANLKHEITYVSESFYGLPFSELLTQINHLSELLALKEVASNPQEYEKHLSYFKFTLDDLNGKIQTQFLWKEETYDWIIMPLFSPTGVRWGTLVECVKSECSERENPNAEILKQQAYIAQIEKELVLFNQSSNQLSIYYQEDEENHFTHPLLERSMHLIRPLGQRVRGLYTEVERLKNELQSQISNSQIKIFASMEQVHLLSTSIIRKSQEFKYDFTSSVQELGKLKVFILEQNGLNQSQFKSLQNTIQIVKQGLFESVMLYELVILSLQAFHENQNLNKVNDYLNDMLKKLEKIKTQWENALEFLSTSLDLNKNLEQSSQRWNVVCEKAENTCQKCHQHILEYMELTQKMSDKTALLKLKETEIKSFNKIVIEQNGINPNRTDFVLIHENNN